MDVRSLLAAVLGVGIGLLLVAAPEALVRVHTVGRVPGQRGGEYGTDDALSARTRRLVQLLGVACVAVGLYVGTTLVL